MSLGEIQSILGQKRVGGRASRVSGASNGCRRTCMVAICIIVARLRKAELIELELRHFSRDRLEYSRFDLFGTCRLMG